MTLVDKVIFVCTDNTCRSIMAEAVMRSVLRNRKIDVASRGLVVLFPEPLNPKAVAVLAGNQMMPAKKCSEALEAEDITENTLILTMTAKEAATVRERFPERERVFTLGEFVGRPGDIEEPHGGTLAEYGACYEYIDLLVKFSAEKLFKAENEREIQAVRIVDGKIVQERRQQ